MLHWYSFTKVFRLRTHTPMASLLTHHATSPVLPPQPPHRVVRGAFPGQQVHRPGRQNAACQDGTQHSRPYERREPQQYVRLLQRHDGRPDYDKPIVQPIFGHRSSGLPSSVVLSRSYKTRKGTPPGSYDDGRGFCAGMRAI